MRKYFQSIQPINDVVLRSHAIHHAQSDIPRLAHLPRRPLIASARTSTLPYEVRVGRDDSRHAGLAVGAQPA
jgi:hypothetical protein